MELWVKANNGKMLCVEDYNNGVATISGFAGASVKDLINTSMECLQDPSFEEVLLNSFRDSATPLTSIRFEANGAYCVIPIAERNPAFIYQNWLRAVSNI